MSNVGFEQFDEKQDAAFPQHSTSESGNSGTTSSSSPFIKKIEPADYVSHHHKKTSVAGECSINGGNENSVDQSFEDTTRDDAALNFKRPSVRYASLPQITKTKADRGGLVFIPSGESTPSLESTTTPPTQNPSTPIMRIPTSNIPSRPSSVAGTEDENSGEEEEDYDWSTEGDILDENAKQIHSEPSNKKKFTLKRIIVFFLSTLIGSTILSAIFSSIPIFLHFFYLKSHPTDHRRYITDNVSAWFVWLAINILVSWYLALLVDIISLVLPYVIYIVWGVVSEGIISRIEIYNAVKGRFKPVLYAAYAWGSWVVIFAGIYGLYNHHEPSQSLAGYTRRTYQAIEFIFFLILVFSIEKILSHWIAFVFHRKAYEDRLQALEKGLRVIDHLRTHRPKRISQGHAHAHRSSAGIWGTMGFGWGSSVGPESVGNSVDRDDNKLSNRLSKLVGTPVSTLLGTPMFEKAGFNFGGGGTTGNGALTNPMAQNTGTAVSTVAKGSAIRPSLNSVSTMPLLPLAETDSESFSGKPLEQTLKTGLQGRTPVFEDDKTGHLADNEHGFGMVVDAPKTGTQMSRSGHKKKRTWPRRKVRYHSPTRPDFEVQRGHVQSENKNEDEAVVEMGSFSDRPYKPVQTINFSREASSDAYHVPDADGKIKTNPKPLSPELKKSDASEDAVFMHAARALKSAVLYDARNLKGKDDDLSGGGGWERIGNAREAKRLARSIYTSFKPLNSHRKYLIPSDFYPAYTNHADAEAAFKVFDKDNNGDISRTEVKGTIWKLYKERRALVRSLRDASNALRTLDWVMMVLAAVIVFFISLSIFNVAVGSSLTSFYTIGIAASFIFKTSASSAFDAVMFLFVTHPFDTGDRVFVDDENLVVKKMGLFATTFSRSDGTETYYFNSQLFQKFIVNVRRSGTTFENGTFQVAWRTPLEKLDQLEKSMNDWLATEENRWFEPQTAVTLQKIDYQRSLEFTMGIGHNGTWQDWGLRNARKNAFMAAVQFYCSQLGITHYESNQPILLRNTNENIPLSPTSLTSPNNAATASGFSKDDGVVEIPQVVKPRFGFVPPPDKRTTLVRMRKSKLRKANVRGMAQTGE